MKKIIAFALCALFAIHSAEARTIYVNAKRPNNKGSGLSVKKAKKTIQAAINIAKKGDKILVYPGTYAPIKTNNKKIAIKSVKGAKKTKIVAGKKGGYFVRLGNTKVNGGGKATALTGFLADGKCKGYRKDGQFWTGVWAGTWKSCTIRHINAYAVNGKFVDCVFRDNYRDSSDGDYGFIVCDGTATRCKFLNNEYIVIISEVLKNCIISQNSKMQISTASLGNCLIADNPRWETVSNSVLINCTMARNSISGTTKVPNVCFWNSAFVNCISWGNYDGLGRLHNVEPDSYYHKSNAYRNCYAKKADPKFANAAKGNYRLKKGSPCINKGKLTKAQKKFVGKKDLAGKKRVKGKAVDIGCYEF